MVCPESDPVKYVLDSSRIFDTGIWSVAFKLANEKFAELCDEISGAVDSDGCEIIDEPTHYSVINREAGIFGYVRIVDD